LVRPDALRRYCNGFDPIEIARVFQRRGALIASKNDPSKIEQVPGRTDRFYVLSLTSLTP